jgi:hypothetical protein
MKFHETHFEEYIHESTRANLHPSLEKMHRSLFPKHLADLRNVIFYGPPGVGKYTQMLRCIRKYSASGLKYEKKITIVQPKENYFIKISDVHYEIDMSLLGCNPKNLWHDIYLHVIDIISSSSCALTNINANANTNTNTNATATSQPKGGILVCKNFHEIHNELLEIFYSYMQKNVLYHSAELKFILLTDELSFLPDNILQCCSLLRVPRPTNGAYKKCFATRAAAVGKELPPIQRITNNKYLFAPGCDALMQRHERTCDKLLPYFDPEDKENATICFLTLRELLYDIFICGLDMFQCVWYLLHMLAKKNTLHARHLSEVLFHTFKFFQYFNNNYRPICHLELFVLQLVKIFRQ